MPNLVKSPKNVIFVSTALDNGIGSLRDAVQKSNSRADLLPSKIIIKPLLINKILLLDEIVVSSNIKIINESGRDLVVAMDPTKNARLFHIIQPASTFIISQRCNKIILSDGNTIENGGAIFVEPTNHNLFLKNVVITNNKTAKSGGGIYTNGTLTLVESIIERNLANNQGGGIWSAKSVLVYKTRINNNGIVVPNVSNGGGGIFVDGGDCTLDRSSVLANTVAYNLNAQTGGSGGGIIVLTGSIYVQNNSHVDQNTAYNSGGIQEGMGNVYLTNGSSSSNNKSFNAVQGAAGGGGITITLGTVYVSDGQIVNNKTQGMYSGGIVSLVGNTVVTNRSRISGNTNNGPGGGIAANAGSVKIDGKSHISDNIGASLGGGIVNFSPIPGSISVSGRSQITNNIVTNAETIRQTIEIFLSVVTGNLSDMTAQATQSGGQGAQQLIAQIPNILSQLANTSNLLKALPLNELISKNTIAGGGIASLLTSAVIVDNSVIKNNFAGKNISSTNFPFDAIGGGIFSFASEVLVQKSLVSENISQNSGGGIWAGTKVTVSESVISCNKQIKTNSNGGGIFNGANSACVLFNSKISLNEATSRGGGIYNEGTLSLFSSKIIDNCAGVDGGGIYSTKQFLDVDTIISTNRPNNVVVDLII